eukprot:gene57706-biopygen6140
MEIMVHGTDGDKECYSKIMEGDSFKTESNQLKCGGQLIDAMVRHPSAKKAGLQRHHVLALRLYTGSIYPLVNGPLRKETKPHPLMATCYFISEGIKKLRAVEDEHDPMEQRTFFRGMKDLKVPVDFAKQGGVEMACMSTTLRKDLAFHYSKSTNGLVFQVNARNFMSRGANLEFLSIFPNEKEYLYPPGTFMFPQSIKEETLGSPPDVSCGGGPLA